MIISVDGGPDENPRYEKVIHHSIDHFKKYNFDAFYVVTNAPGRSAYNRVERRMAQLSHQLSGVILPYDYFGSHLNTQGKTIDEVLEKKIFSMQEKCYLKFGANYLLMGTMSKQSILKRML